MGEKSFTGESEHNLNAFSNIADTVTAKRQRSFEGSATSQNTSPRQAPMAPMQQERQRSGNELAYGTSRRRLSNDTSHSNRTLPSIAHLTAPLDSNMQPNFDDPYRYRATPAVSDGPRVPSHGSHGRQQSLPGFHRQDAMASKTFGSILGYPGSGRASPGSNMGERGLSLRTPDSQDRIASLRPEESAQLAPISQGQAFRTEELGKTPPSGHDFGQIPPAKSAAAESFRRDMQLIEDWTSRVYYFATNAAPGTGNDVPLDPSNVRPIRIPSRGQFDTAIAQVRDTLKIIESWRDSEHGTPAAMRTYGSTESTAALPDSTSSSGDGLRATSDNGNSNKTTPLSATRHAAAWDQADTEAMRKRKRSAPKNIGPSGSGQIPTPIKSHSDGSNFSARVAPPGKCHSCKISETPEWRRGPDGARTLCNACGLHFAKMAKKKMQRDAASRSPPA